MSGELISGLFGLAGVIVGSASSLFTAILVNRLNKKKRIYGEALDQIIGYWNLEEEMAKHIHTLENKSRSTKTIKEDFHLMVYSKKNLLLENVLKQPEEHRSCTRKKCCSSLYPL